jgi:hypothetical protein
MQNTGSFKVLAIVVLLAVTNVITWNVAKSGGSSSIVASSSGMPPSPTSMPGGIRVIGGTVESISDSSFTLNVPSYDPSSQGGSVRTVKVNSDTVLEQMVQKDPATIQKEQTAFMENIKSSQNASGAPTGAPIVPPEPFSREKIALKDLVKGDMVSVIAGEDVSKAKTFTAVSVAVQQRIAPPSVPDTIPSSAPAVPSPTSQN